jgi:O-antigen biosynthesis protein
MADNIESLLENEIDVQNAVVDRLNEDLGRAREEIERLLNSKTYRWLKFPRSVYAKIRARKTKTNLEDTADPEGYRTWLRRTEIDVETSILAQLRTCSKRPKISIIMPVFNTEPKFLVSAVESVRNQIYSNWELCVVDDASTNPATVATLKELEQADVRIKFSRREVNGHISVASNEALKMSTGEWIAFLDHDDTLSEVALAAVVVAINSHPEARFIYSDKDKIDEMNERAIPLFKSDFDSLLLLAQNYLCHFTAIEEKTLRRSGGFREGFEGAQDWDLFLRVTENLHPSQIIHVPYVLYHWRISESSTAGGLEAKAYALEAGRRAVLEHLDRIGLQATLETDEIRGWNRVIWDVPSPAPRVTIVIPTRDGKTLEVCLKTLSEITDYPNFNVIVVDNGSKNPETLSVIEEYARKQAFSVLRDDRPFNYSALNNEAVRKSESDFICLMNDDIEIISPGWLREMVSQFARPGVGIVGAKLFYPDGTLQHVGVVLGIGGVAAHSFGGAPGDSLGYRGKHLVAHTVSCVTAACLLVKREVWNQLDGLNEEDLTVAFNDVDFCIRAGQTGWSIVWTPHAELIHHESLSRGSDETEDRIRRFQDEIKYMRTKWQPILDKDPFYNPNLTLVTTDWRFSHVPRHFERSRHRLDAGFQIYANEPLYSFDGTYVGQLDLDGDWRTLRENDSSVIQEIKLDGLGHFMTLQSDGNLVIYGRNGMVVWSADVLHDYPSHMIITDDGYLSIIDLDGNAYWSSDAINQIKN